MTPKPFLPSFPNLLNFEAHKCCFHLNVVQMVDGFDVGFESVEDLGYFHKPPKLLTQPLHLLPLNILFNRNFATVKPKRRLKLKFLKRQILNCIWVLESARVL